jgi:hypothetical protein
VEGVLNYSYKRLFTFSPDFLQNNSKKGIFAPKIKKMSIMVEKIGCNAGKVWTQLDAAGRSSVKDLKKLTKLTDKDLYAAIGWLAREGKLTLEEVDKEIFVSLK